MTVPDAPDGVVEGQEVLLSPEQVALHLPLAGPSSRILAYAVDYALVFALELLLLLLLVLVLPIGEWGGDRLRELASDMQQEGPVGAQAILLFVALFILFQLVVEWAYFTFFELVMGGRSPGKRLLGLRVMCDGGMPITLRESLIRNLLRLVDVLPANYFVGLVSIVMSAQGKRLGDFAAGTIVVRLDRIPRPEPLPEPADEGAAFRFDRSQVARLGAAEGQLVRQTLRRLESLPPEAAARLLEQAVEALRARLAYEPVPEEERRAFLMALLRELRRR